MNNYHIDGVSGSGKTTVCEELKRRGYQTVDADEELAYFGNPETGEPDEKTERKDFVKNWIWDKEKTLLELNKKSDKPTFFCGGTMNLEHFAEYFKKTFILHIDDETLKYRLANRINNDFGKHPDELAMQLEWNTKALKNAEQKGAIIIDATKSVEEVVDEILSYI